MAHYAIINPENIVIEVITGRDEDDLVEGVNDWETYYSSKRDGLLCKRTSYNTYRDADGVPQHKNGGTPFRGMFAGIGMIYNPDLDEFFPAELEQ